MPFISQKDNRQRMQTYTPAEYIETPDFSEVFNASVGLAIDESMSISRALNNEMYRERDSRVKQLRDEGFDVPKYINRAGKLDYDRLSRDTDDFIQTDTVLRERRNEKLRQRREYAEDVIERGSGYAQFFGMATGFMLDPINIATLPIATAGVAAKGLGVLASAMNVAGREAAIATAAELAIQPLVYTHKLDIESPYSTDDALMAIGGAAVGGALLGGAAGGLAGYFRKVGQKSREVINPDIDSPEDMAINALERIAEDIDSFKKSTIYSDMAADYAEAASSYGRYADDINKTLAKSRDKLIREIEKEIKVLEKEPKYGRKIAEEYGGLNQESWLRTADMSNKEFGTLPGGYQKPFWRSGNKGLAPDALAERLYEDGVISSFDRNEAIAFVEDLLRKGNRFVDPEVEMRVAVLNENFDSLSKAPDEELADFYEQAVVRDMEDDIELLREYEAKMARFNEPSRAVINYVDPEPQKAASATVTERERDILERNGLAEDYDAAIQAFRNIDDPQLFVDGEIINANDFMKQLDDEIEGINSVLECTLG
tara:strand:- start:2341 stop:3972 length:1632 start_codon:yes stop_codon:yes gene_type:complete